MIPTHCLVDCTISWHSRKYCTPHCVGLNSCYLSFTSRLLDSCKEINEDLWSFLWLSAWSFSFGTEKYLSLLRVSLEHYALPSDIYVKLWLPHVAFHLHTCSQQPDLVFPLWSFRQSVHSRILHLSHATKLLYQRWWVPVFIQRSHLSAVMDYWDGCMLLNVVIKLAKKSMLKHDGNEDV